MTPFEIKHKTVQRSRGKKYDHNLLKLNLLINHQKLSYEEAMFSFFKDLFDCDFFISDGQKQLPWRKKYPDNCCRTEELIDKFYTYGTVYIGMIKIEYSCEFQMVNNSTEKMIINRYVYYASDNFQKPDKGLSKTVVSRNIKGGYVIGCVELMGSIYKDFEEMTALLNSIMKK